MKQGHGREKSALVAFLVAAAGGAAAARHAFTHASHVVIGPKTAFKLKLPVTTGYLDFSTPEKRLAFCTREVEVNRENAPMIYRAARRITREPNGDFAFDGVGDMVDAVVEMTAFDASMTLDRMDPRSAIGPSLVEQLAGAVAHSHERAPIHRDRGGAARLARVLDVNRRAFVDSGLFSEAEAIRFDAAFRSALSQNAALLDARAEVGRVRRCHGDLHLGNVCLIGGKPVLFDALEFNEDLATVDVLYDLAFLAMDLWRHGRRLEASALVNRYADMAGEAEGLALLPFFLAVRAAVRAHVTASAGRPDATDYVDLARAALVVLPPRVVAIGGLSGSGKTTLAARLAPRLGPPPGARVLNSDRLRKKRFAVAPDRRLPRGAYAKAITDAVYEDLINETARLARAGCSVVADAVFAEPNERAAIAAAAGAARFDGLWLFLPVEALKARVAARKGGPSDATVAVVERQTSYDLGTIDWQRLDASAPLEPALAALGSTR